MLLDNYFNESYVSEEVTEESPYTLGLEGAMMHVYELECNYNKLMEAAGMAELRYYQQTGGDLFVNEAGAFGGFIEKAKEFFKKVIEKIKMIFNKFVSKIHSLVGSNKSFVKKYRTEILKKSGSIKDMDFNGYEFGDLAKSISTDFGADKYTALKSNIDTTMAASNDDKYKYSKDSHVRGGIKDDLDKDSDAIEDIIESQRAKIIGQSGSLSEDEFRDEVKDLFYGADGKTSLDDIKLIDQIRYVDEVDKTIKEAKRERDKLEKAINKYIKGLEKFQTEIAKSLKDEKTAGTIAARETNIKNISNAITIERAMCNSMLIFYGIKLQALKDRAAQAKAICVKAMAYKESASYYDESYGYGDDYSDYNDVFSGVDII